MTLVETLSQAFAFVKTYPLQIFLGLLVLRLLTNKFRPTLYSIPGPPIAAWTALWRLYDVWKGQAHMTAIALHKKYGPLVRIGPNHVSVSDPKAINIIYGLKTGFTKTAFYPIQCVSWQKKPQMNIFSTRDPAYHRDQKKLIANAYSMSSLLEMESKVDECSVLFMQQLNDRFASKGKPADLGTWLQFYAFDVVGEISFDKKLGFLEQGSDVDNMMKLIEGMLSYASLCGQVPEWHPILLGNPLWTHLYPKMETWNEVLNFTLKAVNARASLKRDGELTVEDEEKGKDQLSRWTSVKRENPGKMSTRDIIVHLSTNVFAGSDTTAIALRAIIWSLCHHPDKYDKFVKQIDEADKAGKLSEPVSFREANDHLPYLEAVMKEAMRLHPSVGLLMERHVPAGGVDLCGRHIPAGTIVGINGWVVQRDPNIFPDPGAFIPERWLESSKEKLKEMDDAYLVFGAGSRVCLGRNISWLEMTKVIPQLFREYKISLAHPSKEWKTTNHWFVQQEGLICNLERRRPVKA